MVGSTCSAMETDSVKKVSTSQLSISDKNTDRLARYASEFRKSSLGTSGWDSVLETRRSPA